MNHPTATYVVQMLLETTDAAGLAAMVAAVARQFRWLSNHPAGCRVVQKILALASSEQVGDL